MLRKLAVAAIEVTLYPWTFTLSVAAGFLPRIEDDPFVRRQIEALDKIIAETAEAFADATTCSQCERLVIKLEGRWIDPEADGDDEIWRKTCDASETFTAEHVVTA